MFRPRISVLVFCVKELTDAVDLMSRQEILSKKLQKSLIENKLWTLHIMSVMTRTSFTQTKQQLCGLGIQSIMLLRPD